MAVGHTCCRVEKVARVGAGGGFAAAMAFLWWAKGGVLGCRAGSEMGEMLPVRVRATVWVSFVMRPRGCTGDGSASVLCKASSKHRVCQWHWRLEGWRSLPTSPAMHRFPFLRFPFSPTSSGRPLPVLSSTHIPSSLSLPSRCAVCIHTPTPTRDTLGGCSPAWPTAAGGPRRDHLREPLNFVAIRAPAGGTPEGPDDATALKAPCSRRDLVRCCQSTPRRRRRQLSRTHRYDRHSKREA